MDQGVCFSMPLCRSKVEQVNAEVLVELSEIEKYNLGQVSYVFIVCPLSIHSYQTFYSTFSIYVN